METGASLIGPMSTSEKYYHCFMGNGIDAVLIGPTGAMVEERAQGDLDRCYWYKADRYYPEDRVVPIPGRLPREGQPLYAEGAAWREIAPIARTWYTVKHEGLTLSVRSSKQRFEPDVGVLYSSVDYGAVQAEVTTFLHAMRPLLAIRYVFSEPVTLRAYLGAGPWVAEGYEIDPFTRVEAHPGETRFTYRLDGMDGSIALALEASGGRGQDEEGLWQEVTARHIVQYVAVADKEDGGQASEVVAHGAASGFDALIAEHTQACREYAEKSSIEIPSAALMKVYEASMYHFKACQNRKSGGLPVNNLRLTWSSHVFWDAYFMHHALLAANRRREARQGVRFFERTLDHAKKHAQDDFGATGLKWDWEITHTGQAAYGTWVHQKEQVHNNASYANMIWGYYEQTCEPGYLEEVYSLLKGLAEFFMASVVEQTERGYEVRALTDVGEHVQKVRNEGLNLTGAIRILRIAADAAELVGRDADFAAECRMVAGILAKTLDLLYNGHFFQSAEGDDTLNFSSLAPVYPMLIIAPDDPRGISTTKAYLEQHDREKAEGETFSAWSAGILATVFAMQGDGDTAWRLIEECEAAMCEFGGLSEHTFANGHWNMQYFSTAQGAVCTAIQSLLLQSRGEEICVFPAVPAAWPSCSFEKLLVHGIEVSASLDRAARHARVELKDISGADRQLKVRFGDLLGDVVENIQIDGSGSVSRSWDITGAL